MTFTPASAADIARWKSDPRTPMYEPQIAASAPTPEPATDDDFPYFMHLLGGPFRRFGKRPPTGDFDIPPAAGSASDVQNSWKGCAAQ
jgi:hypothetical protein